MITMKKILLIVLSMIMMSSMVNAKSVTVNGEGITATEAENAALREAVENTLGVLVDSQTLVQNYMVVNDQIYTQSRGFISDYQVLSKKQTSNGSWIITIKAEVDDNPNSKLMNELTRLGIIDNKLRNPKIAVYIPEQHIQRRIPDPAGETALVKTLLEAGFNNVIEVGSRMSISNPLRMNANQLTQAAKQFNVDIMIVGEAFSEGVGDPAQYLPGRQTSNMKSCRARVEAKMFILRTGQIIAADGKYSSAMDISEAVASKKALAGAGQQIGEYFVEQILKLGSGNRNSMQVIVTVSDFSKINLIQTALNQINGVSGVSLANYEGGKGTFNVNYTGAPQTLFNGLNSSVDFDLKVISMTYNELHIMAR